jgi:hypothetical protein
MSASEIIPDDETMIRERMWRMLLRDLERLSA